MHLQISRSHTVLNKMLVFLFLFLLFNYSLGVCPNGTVTIPSSFGSNWNCLLLSPSKQQFVMAELQCTISNGHLISIPNGFVDLLIAGSYIFGIRYTINQRLFQIKLIHLSLVKPMVLPYDFG